MRKNFSKSVKLFDIAAQDCLRPALQCIHFENGYAYATDGHMLIRAKLEDVANFGPEELEILEGRCISADSLKRIYSHQVVEVTNDGFVAEDSTTGSKVTYSFTDPNVIDKFPDCEKVLCDAIQSPLHPKDVIGISYSMLDTLTNAMGCKGSAKIEFRGYKGYQALVTSLDLFNSITGLLMLKQVEEEKK